MDLRRFRYFVAVADTGTVRAAAEREFLTQPALSRQIQLLEREFGVTLFDRRGGRLVLSAAGAALMPRVRHLLASADELMRDASLTRQGRVERISIAAPSVTLSDIVSPFIATMTANDPLVDIKSGDGKDIGEMLERGADIAIGTGPPSSQHATAPLPPLPVWAYVRPDDELATRSQVGLDELVSRQLIVLPPRFTSREALDQAVEQQGLHLDGAVQAANGAVAQAMAASGRGVALVSDDTRFNLRAIRVDTGRGPLTIRLLAAWKHSSPAAPTFEHLARRVSEWTQLRYDIPAATND
jgi:LysR family transcriptional regulator, benzoate and cis,cis-muconate-responsive activator of ben and cat genes